MVGEACVVARGGMCGCRGCAWLQGACVVAGGHAWLPREHVWLPGGMHGWGACVVAGGHAWLQGVCVWLQGGMHGCPAGHAWLRGGGMCRIRRDTVNERAVRILLECILVQLNFYR